MVPLLILRSLSVFARVRHAFSWQNNTFYRWSLRHGHGEFFLAGFIDSFYVSPLWLTVISDMEVVVDTIVSMDPSRGLECQCHGALHYLEREFSNLHDFSLWCGRLAGGTIRVHGGCLLCSIRDFPLSLSFCLLFDDTSLVIVLLYAGASVCLSFLVISYCVIFVDFLVLRAKTRRQ